MTPDDCPICKNALLVLEDAQRGRHLTCTKPEEPDYGNDPEYQAYVDSMIPLCHCCERERPCDGVLAGGICDNIQEDNRDLGYEDDDGI